MEESIIEKASAIRDLEKQLAEFEEREMERDENAEKLSSLYQMGLINEDGEPVAEDEEHKD